MVAIASMESFDLPSIGMDVIKVNVDSVRRVPAHESESLGSQAIRPRCIGAFVPFHAREINPVIVGDRVQTASDRCTARSCSPVGMVIGLIYIGVVIEILVHAHQ